MIYITYVYKQTYLHIEIPKHINPQTYEQTNLYTYTENTNRLSYKKRHINTYTDKHIYIYEYIHIYGHIYNYKHRHIQKT